MIAGLPSWPRMPGLVLAPGPSLPALLPHAIAARTHGACRLIGVGDAYRLTAHLDLLYHSDAEWWEYHHRSAHIKLNQTEQAWHPVWCPFVSSTTINRSIDDNKAEIGPRLGLVLVPGENGSCFNLEAPRIHYGQNSGFAAVNLAMHLGLDPILLVGFDLRRVNGDAHFFGEHPAELRRTGGLGGFVQNFDNARLPLLEADGPTIYNATPDSALRSYEFRTIEEVTREYRTAALG